MKQLFWNFKKSYFINKLYIYMYVYVINKNKLDKITFIYLM